MECWEFRLFDLRDFVRTDSTQEPKQEYTAPYFEKKKNLWNLTKTQFSETNVSVCHLNCPVYADKPNPKYCYTGCENAAVGQPDTSQQAKKNIEVWCKKKFDLAFKVLHISSE